MPMPTEALTDSARAKRHHLGPAAAAQRLRDVDQRRGCVRLEVGWRDHSLQTHLGERCR